MNLKRTASIFIFVLLSTYHFAQITAFKQNNKWGFTKNGAEFIAPIYDTVLPFDSVKHICMACVKTMKPNNNKFIKMNNSAIVCKYLNEKNESLVIKIKEDTCGYFNFNKNAAANYTRFKDYTVVSAKEKKYVVDNNFKQITFTSYDEIIPTSIKDHFIVENKTIGASYLNGVINTNEKLVIPMEYTHIKSNPFDTLFIACTAQIKIMGYDDVFDMKGKKVHSYNRHIDNASKNFIIHRVFEPTEYYVILDLKTKKEKTIYAEDITYLGNDMVNIKIKGKYNKCNLFELDTYPFLNHE